MTRLGLVAVAGTLMLVGGCMMQNQSASNLSGPSTAARSVGLISTPQKLTRDGQSQAVVTASVRDEIADAPVPGQRLLLTATPSTAILSSREITTGTDGRAIFTVTAPPAASTDSLIKVSVAPVGGISDSVAVSYVSIQLIFDSNLNPAARFSVVPAQPSVGQQAVLDATASTAITGAAITRYAWNFGDGTTAETTTPTVYKVYDEARTFAVTLTVTDNAGRSSTTAKTVTVSP